MVFGLLLPRVSGLSFSINSPSTVKINEEFEVSINAATEERYDVKIMVYNAGPRDIVSQIFYNGTWKSSFYYVKGAFPEQTTFRIKVRDFSGAATICGRMHKFNVTSSTYDESCKPIFVNASGSEAIISDQNDTKEDDEDNRENVVPNESQVDRPSFVPLNGKEEIVQEEPTSRKIVLSNKETTNEEKSKTYITPEGRTQQIVIYVFAGICVVLAILIVLGKA